ncbi:MAG: hypothetical protein VZR24_15795 [Butyrivibrio hungatei]|nr:hypothetical protein [Butyrivibrio hungatei]
MKRLAKMLKRIQTVIFLMVGLIIISWYVFSNSKKPQLPQEFLKNKFYDEPTLRFSKEWISIAQDDYLFVFYYNEFGAATVACFYLRSNDWEKNFLRTSGNIRITSDDISAYPLISSAIDDEQNKTLTWGYFADPKVRKVLVAGIPATEVSTEGTLWFAITDTTESVQEVEFLDEKEEMMKTVYY